MSASRRQHSIELASIAREPAAGAGYTRLGELGKGANGVAYLAKDRADAKFVIKEVSTATLDQKELADAHREIKVLRELFHPNIVHYKESYKDGLKLCIVMEYCENGNLYERITKGEPLSELEIWEWFVQVCKALEYMHSCRVIHRDLTTKNILISRDSTLRVGDFGLAKRCLKRGDLQLSKQNAAVTVITPEMLDDDVVDKVTDKTDVWAVGGILYFMIMRKLAFVLDDAKDMQAQIAVRIVTGKYVAIPETFSPELRNTVAQLFNINPAQRPSIRKVLASPPVNAYTNPADRLLKVYGLKWDEGSLRDRTGKGVPENFYGCNTRDNKTRYEGIAELLTEELYNRMLKCGLSKFSVPKRLSFDSETDSADADFENPGTIIFCTPNYVVAENLLVLIHGGSETMRTKAGQWARRTMVYSKSIESGTQLPYIRAAQSEGYGLVILNGNDRRPGIEGCESFASHASYVWENYVMKSEAHSIAVKSHSSGGSIVSGLYKKFGDYFRERVFANAYTGDGAIPMPVDDYTIKVSRSWVVSTAPVGSAVPGRGKLECFSAGTNEHSLTPHKAVQEVFKFIKERFEDYTPGNLAR